MGDKIQRVILYASAFLAVLMPSVARAQSEQRDSLVRLLKASSVELIEKYGKTYRKAVDATFLHNGTFLICDTALWNVDSKTINCQGNVQLLQNDTELTSDKLDYLIEEDLAQFRGAVVQLRNKQDNILRTRNLDYNTKDSIAVFKGGASMKDKDGQIIESDDGTYESAAKLFTFRGNVNMFTDSVFVKTTLMTYDSERNLADFKERIDFWKDGNMLSGGKGWYNRNQETFFFREAVHALSEQQETWSDTLYFHRLTNNVELMGHAQVQDTTRNVFSLGDRIFYEDTLSLVTLTGNAAVAIKTTENEKVDTLYCGADRFEYQTVKKCDIPDGILESALKRLDEIMSDPVSAYRRKAAEQAAQEAAAEKEQKAKERGIIPKKTGDAPAPPAGNPPAAPADSALAPSDSLQAGIDSLSVPTDTLAVVDTIAVEPPKDTTKIGFALGLGNVKIYRKDIQVICDSLRYNDLDSIARFYKDPVVWNDGNRQYNSDSLFVLIKNGGADRASLMSNAFIHTQETEEYYDQIKGTDVMAYFDSTSALKRFDALGGASAIFFLEENGELATVNKVESKMLSATLKDGQVERVYYFDSPKNDAYPIVQLPPKELRMKGFNWLPEKQPRGPQDITSLKIRPGERSRYERRPRATFHQTDIYFPGYMEGVYKSIEDSKERARLRERREAAIRDSLAALEPVLVDTLTSPVSDSLAVAPADSLLSVSPVDTAAVVPEQVDSVAVESVKELTAKELKELQRKERREKAELARALRIARRDARWAEQDARDKAKAEAKEARKQARRRALDEKLRKHRELQEARDSVKLEKFIDYYTKQKIRNEGKQESEPSGERPQGTPDGGELPAPVGLEPETA